MPGLKSSKLMAFTHFLLTLKTSVLYNAEELFRGASRGALRRAAGLCTAGSFFHALHCCCFSLGGGVGGGAPAYPPCALDHFLSQQSPGYSSSLGMAIGLNNLCQP